jgi:hypothetical protein
MVRGVGDGVIAFALRLTGALNAASARASARLTGPDAEDARLRVRFVGFFGIRASEGQNDGGAGIVQRRRHPILARRQRRYTDNPDVP